MFLFLALTALGCGSYYGYKVYQAYEAVPDETLVICSPHAGLGNQLFQYAAGLALSKRLNCPLALSISDNVLDLTDLSTSNRPIALTHFNIPNVKKFERRHQKYLRFFKNKNLKVNDSIFFDIKDHQKLYYMDDWFESEYFFESVKDDVRSALNPEALPRGIEAKKWEEHIIQRGTNSCFVHVRRGDLSSQILSLSYTQKAMKLMREKNPYVVFYVFSDDAHYLQETFKEDESLHIVSNGVLNLLEEFFLMTRCTHGIIANSTFSWWAAYLRKDQSGIVMAPEPRFKREYYENQEFSDKVIKWKIKFYFDQPVHVYPQEWLRVSVDR